MGDRPARQGTAAVGAYAHLMLQRRALTTSSAARLGGSAELSCMTSDRNL